METTKAGGVGGVKKVGGDGAFLADSVKIPELLLSQSGSIATAQDGHKQLPLIPGQAGQFTELVVTGLSPSGVRFTNHFPIDEKGMLHWAQNRPLGHVPYELTLVGKDGAKFSATVDITPGKTGTMHSGYEILKDLKLEREKPPAPATLEVPELLLSQSGSIATNRDGHKQAPLVPGIDGLTELHVIGMSPSGTRFENTFPIDDKGMLHWAQNRPLGHVPYRLEIVDKEGNRWRADVDISPSKTGTMHSGYEVLNKLKFERVPADADAAARSMDGEREGLRNFAAQTPVAGEKTSPLAAFWGKK